MRHSPITTHDLSVAALKVPPKLGGLPVPTHVDRRARASRAAAEDFAAWILANRGESALARFPDLVPLAPTTSPDP